MFKSRVTELEDDNKRLREQVESDERQKHRLADKCVVLEDRADAAERTIAEIGKLQRYSAEGLDYDCNVILEADDNGDLIRVNELQALLPEKEDG